MERPGLKLKEAWLILVAEYITVGYYESEGNTRPQFAEGYLLKNKYCHLFSPEKKAADKMATASNVVEQYTKYS